MFYTCTFAGCQAFFSNAPDWRFHTLTAHCNPKTIWVCTENLKRSIVGPCHSGFKRACDLRTHLKEIHGVPIHNDETVSSLAIGPNRQHFWCGFCRAAIHVSRHGEIAWKTTRAEHIQAHFLCWNGVCANNDLWVDVICRDTQAGGNIMRGRQYNAR
jgi:hypothetical protein